MNSEAAGTTKKNLLSQQDYLAPLPIPTGEKPVDMANMIWRKNDVFLDIGNFNVGGVMVLWCAALFYLCLGLGFKNIDPEVTKFAILSGLVIVGIPTLVFIYNLSRPTPLPIRFIASDVKFVCLEKRVNIGLWLGKRSPPQHRSILQSVRQAKQLQECCLSVLTTRIRLQPRTTNTGCGVSTAVAMKPRCQRGNAFAVIWK